MFCCALRGAIPHAIAYVVYQCCARTLYNRTHLSVCDNMNHSIRTNDRARDGQFVGKRLAHTHTHTQNVRMHGEKHGIWAEAAATTMMMTLMTMAAMDDGVQLNKLERVPRTIRRRHIRRHPSRSIRIELSMFVCVCECVFFGSLISSRRDRTHAHEQTHRCSISDQFAAHKCLWFFFSRSHRSLLVSCVHVLGGLYSVRMLVNLLFMQTNYWHIRCCASGVENKRTHASLHMHTNALCMVYDGVYIRTHYALCVHPFSVLRIASTT